MKIIYRKALWTVVAGMAILLMAVSGVSAMSSAPPEGARPPVTIRYVTTQSFAADVLESPLPVLLQFDASWCPYCRKIRPLLSQLAADRAGELVVYRIDVDREKGLANLFSVRSLPTLVLMNKGVEQKRMEGTAGKLHLYAWARVPSPQ